MVARHFATERDSFSNGEVLSGLLLFHWRRSWRRRGGARGVLKTRELVGVSEPAFARMLGLPAALVRPWECGQREPAPIARRSLDLIRANPSNWRELVEAA